jgi:hypothetical protein
MQADVECSNARRGVFEGCRESGNNCRQRRPRCRVGPALAGAPGCLEGGEWPPRLDKGQEHCPARYSYPAKIALGSPLAKP